MLTLEELIQHRDNINKVCENHSLSGAMPKARQMETLESLDIASKMLSALIYQLENQSMSFTP
jgi:hypothetical protein